MNSNYSSSVLSEVKPNYGFLKWAKRLIISLLVAGSILTGLFQITAPDPAGLDAPENVFSSARAMEKVKLIASEPRFIGTPGHDAVLDYLVSELEGLGLNPEIQKSEVTSELYGGPSMTVQNIVARIPGTDNSKAVMVAAHYDSVSTGPGAADDGAAIAAMLETVRALQDSGSLKNDLILLMTDGEEMGLLGAQAFMGKHPWAKDAGLVLNFEARGNKGPSFMFETSDQNGWIVKEFIKAAPQPIAYSLIYNVYKLMPNDTDLTMFRRGGLAGLNFAFGMGLDAYHTSLDKPENLDPSSLQHQGDYMLSLTRHFGNLDLRQVEQGDRVYFNVLGSNMISYPQSRVIWIMIFAVLLFAGTVGYGLYRQRLSLKRMAGGCLAVLFSLGLIYGAVTLIWNVLQSSVSESQYESIILNPHISIYYLMGIIVLALLIAFLLIRWISRYVGAENIWIGTLLLWLLLAVGTVLFLPGGSYLFTWPLIFSLIGINISFGKREGSWTWVPVLFAIPGFILLAPICYLLYILMTLHVAGILATMAVLAFTLIFPVWSTVGKRRQGHTYRI